MFDDFRLKVFVTAADESSFTGAAAKLGVSQPSVSQHIFELEKHLGTKLFDRRRGEVVLTPEGEIFKEHALKMLENCASVERIFMKLPPASVKIFASEEVYTYIIYPALEKFLAIHRDIVFERVEQQEDADVAFVLKASQKFPFDTPQECIMKLRTSVSPAPTGIGLSAPVEEKTLYFNLLYLPSASFSTTPLCSLLKDFLTSF